MPDTPAPHPNLTAVTDAAVETLVTHLNGLIEKTVNNADVQRFARAIVADAIESAAAGRGDLVVVLGDQARLLAERNRVAFYAGMADAAWKTIAAVLDLAVRVALPAIPRVPTITPPPPR